MLESPQRGPSRAHRQVGTVDSDESRWGLLLVSVALAGCVMFAVGLEMLAATAADTPMPAWTYRVVPLAWSPPRRVAWWLLVAAAAAGHRVAFNRWAGQRRAFVGPVLCALPFVVFAVGVAVHAEWAAWG